MLGRGRGNTEVNKRGRQRDGGSAAKNGNCSSRGVAPSSLSGCPQLPVTTAPSVIPAPFSTLQALALIQTLFLLLFFHLQVEKKKRFKTSKFLKGYMCVIKSCFSHPQLPNYQVPSSETSSFYEDIQYIYKPVRIWVSTHAILWHQSTLCGWLLDHPAWKSPHQ